MFEGKTLADEGREGEFFESEENCGAELDGCKEKAHVAPIFRIDFNVVELFLVPSLAVDQHVAHASKHDREKQAANFVRKPGQTLLCWLEDDLVIR